jgi:hypothetical protein
VGHVVRDVPEEHDELLTIAQQHVVPIIGLVYMDKRDKAKQWLEQLGNPYAAVAFDNDGRTAIDWGVYGAPETFLVDGHGRIIYKFISPMTPRCGNTNSCRASKRREPEPKRDGEFVRFSPPLEPKTLLIWGAPFIVLLVGVGIIVGIVRRRSRMPIDEEPTPDHQ